MKCFCFLINQNIFFSYVQLNTKCHAFKRIFVALDFLHIYPPNDQQKSMMFQLKNNGSVLICVHFEF